MTRKGSQEYKEARKQARRETFVSGSVFPKLVEADRAHNRLWEARNRGARTTQARKEVRERVADYNAAFDAGVARRMGEDKPKPRKGRKTAHVPAGHANGGQFTGESNPPRAPRPGAETKKRRAAVVREQMSAGVSEAKARRYAASVIPASPKASAPKQKPVRSPTRRGMVRPTTPTMQREYHQEIEYDLARALQIADESERDGSWTHAEAQKARGIAKRMATNEHKKVPGWEAPAKKARKRKASAPKRGVYLGYTAEEAREYAAMGERAGDPWGAKAARHKRYKLNPDGSFTPIETPSKPKRSRKSAVPRQRGRTRLNTQQRGEVYSEAREGLRYYRERGGRENRRARGA